MENQLETEIGDWGYVGVNNVEYSMRIVCPLQALQSSILL